MLVTQDPIFIWSENTAIVPRERRSNMRQVESSEALEMTFPLG